VKFVHHKKREFKGSNFINRIHNAFSTTELSSLPRGFRDYKDVLNHLLRLMDEMLQSKRVSDRGKSYVQEIRERVVKFDKEFTKCVTEKTCDYRDIASLFENMILEHDLLYRYINTRASEGSFQSDYEMRAFNDLTGELRNAIALAGASLYQ